MVSPSAEANRRALIAELARRRGYYPPRTPSPATNAPAVNEQEKKSGGFLNAVGNVLKPVFTGSGFLDTVLPGDPGSDIKRGIGKVPVVGKPLAEVVDTVASPFTLATLGAGSAAGAALRGAGGFGRFVAPLVEPVVTGSIGKRLAAEVALNLGAQSGQTLAEKAGLPEPLQLAAGLAGGVVGARSVQNLADRAARTAGGLSADEVAEKLATGDSTDKLTALLSSATTKVDEQNALRSQELGRRAATIAENLSGIDNPGTRAATIRAGQKGALPTAQFELPKARGGLTPAEHLDELVATETKGTLLPVGQRAAPDVIAQKTWYHGTGSEIIPDKLNPSLTKENNLFGHGIYLTDDPKIAAGYAKTRSKRTGTPNVFKMQVAPQSVLDMELPATPEIKSAIAGLLGGLGGYEDDALKLMDEPGVTTERLWEKMTEALSDWSVNERIPSYEVSDMLFGLNDTLREQGWDALTHTGGVRTGRDPHQVLIMLNPNSVDSGVTRNVPIGQTSALRGVATEAVGDPTKAIMPEDIRAIEERVSAHYAATGEVFKEANAHEALVKIFAGQLPQKNEIKLLEEALGTDFGQVLNNLANPQKLASWQTALDVVGVPRAVMASFDLSMPLRQGALGFTRKSWLNSWKPMAQAFTDPKYAEAAAEEIATSTHPAVRALRDQGVITGTPGTLQSLEEAFTSGLAEVIPGVRQSERAAVTFLNKMRADYAKNIYDKWVDAGAEVGTKELDDLVKWTGIVTGRGKLPAFDSSRNAVTLMNSLFFSPKFLASRLQSLNPVMYAQMAPAVRKEAARDMASFFGLGIAGLGAMAVAGKSGVLPGVSVELDPRSSDFAKVRSGQTRIDPWAGFQPIARYMAQLISGESKNSSGDINDRARATTLMNFARGKTAPVPSFLVDALTGTSFTGQEVDVATGAGMDRAAAERLVPLFAQDLADAIAVDGWGGAAKTLPALFGVGSQTYNSAATIRQAGAEEMYNKSWNKLTGKEQAAVNQAYAEQLTQQSAPSAKSVSAYVDNTNLEIRAREQQLFNALGTQIGNREFTGLMNDLLAERNNKIKGVVEFSGINEAKDPTLLDRYFGLREQATTNGVVDYEKLDQLQQNFINQLPTEDQRIITERTSFAHAPEVQWWVDAKKTINESEYYDVQSQAMQQLNGLIQRIAPGVTTYNELNAASLMARTPAESMLISNVVKRVDQVTRRLQQVYRLRNREVDEALGLVYGSTPIRTQLAR